MNECLYTDHVDAYHDGVMTEREAERMADHLRTCPACADRLRQTCAIGQAIAGAAPGPMPPLAKARLRRAVADAFDRATTRFAWELTGLAASVLVAASLWVANLPAPASASADSATWERAAATGGLSLEPSAANDQTADARFASWVLSGLTADNAQEDPQP